MPCTVLNQADVCTTLSTDCCTVVNFSIEICHSTSQSLTMMKRALSWMTFCFEQVQSSVICGVHQCECVCECTKELCCACESFASIGIPMSSKIKQKQTDCDCENSTQNTSTCQHCQSLKLMGGTAMVIVLFVSHQFIVNVHLCQKKGKTFQPTQARKREKLLLGGGGKKGPSLPFHRKAFCSSMSVPPFCDPLPHGSKIFK